MENSTFRELLQEYSNIKGFGAKKIADATSIPQRYIEALLEGDYQTLPPLPYVRGYIGKLAGVLDFDKEEMWRLYKKEVEPVTSGALDRLPSNRYAIKQIDRRIIIGAALVLLIIVYLAINLSRLVGSPKLELIYPTGESLIVEQPIIAIEGKTQANNKLTINGAEVYVDADGRFKKELTLDPGLNLITIGAKKFLGKEAIVERKIIYQPSIIEQTNGQNEP